MVLYLRMSRTKCFKGKSYLYYILVKVLLVEVRLGIGLLTRKAYTPSPASPHTLTYEGLSRTTWHIENRLLIWVEKIHFQLSPLELRKARSETCVTLSRVFASPSWGHFTTAVGPPKQSWKISKNFCFFSRRTHSGTDNTLLWVMNWMLKKLSESYWKRHCIFGITAGRRRSISLPVRGVGFRSPPPLRARNPSSPPTLLLRVWTSVFSLAVY